MLPREYPAYVNALMDVVDGIKAGSQIDDQSLEKLVEAEIFDADRKRIVMGLKLANLITDEQTAFAIAYRWPLKEV